jgi:hypothetical protein
LRIINLDKHIQSCSSSSQSIELEDGIIEGEEIRHFLFLKRTKTNEFSKKRGVSLVLKDLFAFTTKINIDLSRTKKISNR